MRFALEEDTALAVHGWEWIAGRQSKFYPIRACDKAFDVHRCPDEAEALAPDGFAADSHELFLFGRCAACT